MNAVSWLEGFQPPEKWRTWLGAHGPRLATWILALALGVQAALILTALGGADRSLPAAAPSAAGPSSEHRLDVAAIAAAHLFGAAPATPAQDAANAPQTSMPLVLTGIIAADQPQNGLAILGPSAQAAKVYAVGDSVPGGAKLHSVYGDRVVIDRSGQLESLVLPRQPMATPRAAPSAAALPTQVPVYDRMRKLVNEQPGLLADVMRPQATFQDNKLIGFRVYPGRNHRAFARLGLKPGDLIKAINGTPLDDPSRGEEILRTLSTSSEAHVTVLRNEHTQDLTLNVAQVMQEAEAMANGQSGTDSEVPQGFVPPAPGPGNPQ